ncbi:hypothetical protein DXC78_06675 [Faecalicoccus pleomorphus]|uniref:Uncharacterized protein n=1 Tax=Faecalicoccus pleomorphus TaxID=1323 RepID=A0A3E3E5A9_9FIRM|nr:hypothetical protein [Faecalicoccus pleomorphus]RGD76368.1 hypothetical protein DXC78_06675 [Faecalicoccus pleomorphus]
MITREKCEQAYIDLEISREVLKRALESNCELINPANIFDKALVTFARLIHEHFDNPPLVIDDLKMDQEVYDESLDETVLVLGVDKQKNSILLSRFDRKSYFECEFETDRYYRRKKHG